MSEEEKAQKVAKLRAAQERMEKARYRGFEDFVAAYSDVFVPDTGPGARGLEFGVGWIGIVEDYCDHLRAFARDQFFESLVWGKEKFGSLRLYTRSDIATLTPLQVYWLARIKERARRKSLKTCQECGRPGRLRWGSYAATLCDRHSHLVGEPRMEDGVILDPDRQKMRADGTVAEWPENFVGRFTWTDADLGLNQGVTMDLAKQMQIDFAPFLSPDLRLSDDDMALADLRKTLLAVDSAIGRHHAVQFTLFNDRYEITIDNDHPISTVDAIQRERIVDEIEMIMSGEQA